jgi:hypothetical protein
LGNSRQQQSDKSNQNKNTAFKDLVACLPNLEGNGHCVGIYKDRNKVTLPKLVVRMKRSGKQHTLYIDPTTFNFNSPHGKSSLYNGSTQKVMGITKLAKEQAACVLISSKEGVQIPKGNCPKATCPFCAQKK